MCPIITLIWYYYYYYYGIFLCAITPENHWAQTLTSNQFGLQRAASLLFSGRAFLLLQGELIVHFTSPLNRKKSVLCATCTTLLPFMYLDNQWTASLVYSGQTANVLLSEYDPVCCWFVFIAIPAPPPPLLLTAACKHLFPSYFRPSRFHVVVCVMWQKRHIEIPFKLLECWEKYSWLELLLKPSRNHLISSMWVEKDLKKITFNVVF